MTKGKRIVIAGASGFVGMELIRRLSQNHQIIALTRSTRASQKVPDHKAPGVYWVSCNLFSLKQTEAALLGCDIAFFLVHSMSPAAKLTQGHYDDLDLLIADNFSRAAAAEGVKRIIYLGGIQPKSGFLSDHLRSRREVESVLQSRCHETISLRAGLILGPGGSSALILMKLIQRLPVLICPTWTRKMSSPIALIDAIDALEACLDSSQVNAGVYDLTGPENISYRKLMMLAAQKMNLRRLFIPFLGVPPAVSRLWVTLVTGASRELVSPLIQSLQADMLPGRSAPIFSATKANTPLIDALHQAALPRVPIEITDSSDSNITPPISQRASTDDQESVVSIQRMPLPLGWNAQDVAHDYAQWFPHLLRPLLKLKRSADGVWVAFYLRGWKKALLELEFVAERSDDQRALFLVRGGALRKEHSNPSARLEFRVIPLQKLVIAAVLDFVPALPWLLYRLTQAQAHRFVMWCFDLKLRLKRNC